MKKIIVLLALIIILFIPIFPKLLINNKIFELQIQIIINTNLYRKNVIDENTFSKVNDKLLKNLRALQNTF